MVRPTQRLHEEEPEGRRALLNRSDRELFLFEQIDLKLPYVFQPVMLLAGLSGSAPRGRGSISIRPAQSRMRAPAVGQRSRPLWRLARHRRA
jgi:hypothetical protein